MPSIKTRASISPSLALFLCFSPSLSLNFFLRCLILQRRMENCRLKDELKLGCTKRQFHSVIRHVHDDEGEQQWKYSFVFHCVGYHFFIIIFFNLFLYFVINLFFLADCTHSLLLRPITLHLYVYIKFIYLCVYVYTHATPFVHWLSRKSNRSEYFIIVSVISSSSIPVAFPYTSIFFIPPLIKW